jgi:hypothetical protein
MERRTVYIVSGSVVIVLVLLALGVFLLLPRFFAANSQAATATPTATATTTAKHKSVFAPYLKQYGIDIKTKIAQGLHLTPDQLAQQLKAGKTLDAIATTQKVSSTQLQTIVAGAFTSSLQPAVSSGALAQKQITKLVKMMQKNQKTLDRLLSRPDKIHNKHTQGQATPTPNGASV